jgi:hypothetical protein
MDSLSMILENYAEELIEYFRDGFQDDWKPFVLQSITGKVISVDSCDKVEQETTTETVTLCLDNVPYIDYDDFPESVQESSETSLPGTTTIVDKETSIEMVQESQPSELPSKVIQTGNKKDKRELSVEKIMSINEDRPFKQNNLDENLVTNRPKKKTKVSISSSRKKSLVEKKDLKSDSSAVGKNENGISSKTLGKSITHFDSGSSDDGIVSKTVHYSINKSKGKQMGKKKHMKENEVNINPAITQVLSTTRSGRNVVKPLEWWRNEKHIA